MTQRSGDRPVASVSTHRWWGWPPPLRAAATGWWPPTAGSSPSATQRSGGRPVASASTRRWWGWPPPLRAAATGWWPPTAECSPSATQRSGVDRWHPLQRTGGGDGRHPYGPRLLAGGRGRRVFAFGDAPFEGSMGGVLSMSRLSVWRHPLMAAAYWLVAAGRWGVRLR